MNFAITYEIICKPFSSWSYSPYLLVKKNLSSSEKNHRLGFEIIYCFPKLKQGFFFYSDAECDTVMYENLCHRSNASGLFSTNFSVLFLLLLFFFLYLIDFSFLFRFIISRRSTASRCFRFLAGSRQTLALYIVLQRYFFPSSFARCFYALNKECSESFA